MYRKLKVLDEKELKSKTVLLYLDYNVPFSINESGKNEVQDAYRLEQSKDTLKLVCGSAKRIFLVSHFGRPSSEDRKDYFANKSERCSLRFVFDWLLKNGYLDEKISKFLSFNNTSDELKGLKSDKKVYFLENTRLYDEKTLTEMLESQIDLAVYDAFSCAHREPLPKLSKRMIAGPLIHREIQHVKDEWDLVLIGGKKVADKSKLIEGLKSKKVFSGSKIGLEAFRAETGLMKQKLKYLERVKELFEKSTFTEEGLSSFSDEFSFFVPIDFKTIKYENKALFDISEDEVLDIGPRTLELISHVLKQSKNVFWNGPVGKFEDEKCIATRSLIDKIDKLADSHQLDVFIGGGETAEAVRKYSKSKNISISTGGGALLTLMSEGVMPGLDACEKE